MGTAATSTATAVGEGRRGFAGHGMDGLVAASPKKLDQVVDLDTLLSETPEHVRHVWAEYHADEKMMRVSSAMAAADFQRLSRNAAASPLFVLPLAKPPPAGAPADAPAYMCVVLQMQLPYVLLTPLLDYQERGASATPFLSLVFYSELAASKGLVLCRGDVLARPTAGEALRCDEARRLMKLTCAFYTQPAAFRHVHAMNHTPAAFVFEDSLAQAFQLELELGGGEEKGEGLRASPFDDM